MGAILVFIIVGVIIVAVGVALAPYVLPLLGNAVLLAIVIGVPVVVFGGVFGFLRDVFGGLWQAVVSPGAKKRGANAQQPEHLFAAMNGICIKCGHSRDAVERFSWPCKPPQ